MADIQLSTLGSVIKTAYEGEADTNVFTDSEKSKLTGIASGATADQTGAEIKSLYEAESDTNAFTDAEQTKLSGLGTNVNPQTGTSYTLALDDQYDVVTMDNAGANTVLIDPVGTTNYPVGYTVEIIQLGAGATSIEAGAGVTLNGVSTGSGTITAQYDVIKLRHVASDEWIVSGDVGAIS